MYLYVIDALQLAKQLDSCKDIGKAKNNDNIIKNIIVS